MKRTRIRVTFRPNRLPALASVYSAALIAAPLLFSESARTDMNRTNSKVLVGAAAFGDWHNDAPGVRRLITAQDLPDVGKETQDYAEIVPRPTGAMPRVPEGFSVELVASGLAQARVMRMAPNGDLFITNSSANEVRIYRVPPGSAKPTVSEVFATGLHQPYGIAFYPPGPDPKWVYIGNSNSVVRLPYKNGDLKATGRPERIVEGIPPTHHWTRDVLFTSDGKRLLLTVASGSNIALDMFPVPRVPAGLDGWNKTRPLGSAWDTEEDRANILSFDPDGSNEKIYATGIRNPSGITLQPVTGQIWAVVNERDGLGDNTPFDYATHIKEGAFYGWPWFYIGGHEDPRHKGEHADLKDRITVPDVFFQAHSAPLQILFYEGKDFPSEYDGNAFVTLHGSWDRSVRTGYKVVRLRFDKSGKPTGEYEDFMVGFVVSDKQVWGRPTGLTVAKDGSLYVSDDGSGSIWRVSYKQIEPVRPNEVTRNSSHHCNRQCTAAQPVLTGASVSLPSKRRIAEDTLVSDENRKTGTSQSAQMSEAEIDMNLADSFPASDPPSWTLGMDHHRKPAAPDKFVSQQGRHEPCD